MSQASPSRVTSASPGTQAQPNLDLVSLRGACTHAALVCGLCPLSGHLFAVDQPASVDTRVGRGSPFVGFKNYIDLFKADPFFMTALKNTLAYGLVVTAVVVPLGYILAFGLRQIKRVSNAYTFVYFLPYLMPATIIGILFGFFYQPAFGTINYLLGSVGLPSPVDSRYQDGHLDGRDRGNVVAYRVRHFDHVFGAGALPRALRGRPYRWRRHVAHLPLDHNATDVARSGLRFRSDDD